jgi:hypothetical protein
MLCAAHGGRIQRRRSALPTIATESTRARCARRYRGVLHAAWWAARPLLLRTSDRHEARARAAVERGRALRGARCWGVGDCGTQEANRHGGHGQTRCYRAAGARILPSPVNAGPGRGARRRKQSGRAPPGRAGCRRTWGAPGRWQGQGPALQGAGRRLSGRAHPLAAPFAGPGSASLGAATLLARFSPQSPFCGDGGGFRITAVPFLNGPSSWI